MSVFKIYFNLGLRHVLEAHAYEHILFIMALCAIYLIRDWKKLLILITAFTIGHSLTLVSSTLKLFTIQNDIIEFAVPLTILVTALSNLIMSSKATIKERINYFFALVFGLIHGLGYANYLRVLLGKSEEISSQLFAFNVGTEAAQILIVAIFMGISIVFVRIFGVSRKNWNLIISSAVGGIAFTFVVANWPW